MTTFTLQAPMPAVTLSGGATIECQAIDPTTGANVAGVSVKRFTAYGYDVSAETTAIEDVVPAYTVQQA